MMQAHLAAMLPAFQRGVVDSDHYATASTSQTCHTQLLREAFLEPVRKGKIVERILERTAGNLGDITPRVMDRFYAAIPEAKERFQFHQPVKREKLEGEMVEQALYCLMRWHTSRSEIEIILATTVPHHLVALDIPFEQFSGMVDAVCDVVAGTIPAGDEAEQRVWNDLHREIAAFMFESV